MDQRLAELVRAYGEAAGFLEAERIEWLARLTPDEAQAIWNGLCQAWERYEPQAKGLERLEPLRLERLVQVRRACEAVAKQKGLL